MNCDCEMEAALAHKSSSSGGYWNFAHLLVLGLCPAVSPANQDVPVQPVLIFGLLLCRTKCECVRRPLLCGSADKMLKTACKVLLCP